MKWRLIELRELDLHEHYSTVESIISSVGRGDSPTTLIFNQMYDHVTIGKEADRTKKVKTEYCKEKNIPVIRAIYSHTSSLFHNQGTLQCLLVLNKEIPFIINENPREVLIKYASMALKRLGFPVTHPKKTNLIYNEKKIAITGVFTFRRVLFLSVNVFIVSSVEQAEKTIFSPRDMRATCTTLSRERGEQVSADEVQNAILQSFDQIPNLKIESGNLTDKEEALRDKLREKYTSEQWIKTGRWSPVKDYWRPG